VQPSATIARRLSLAATVILAVCIQPISGQLNPVRELTSSGHWWPMQGAGATGFAGSAACSPCHARLAASHQLTGMAKALRSAENCQVLASHPSLTYRDHDYTYQIDRQSGRSLYKVSYRDESISVPLSYCFGHGEAGQTYLLQYKDAFYESRVSFYPAVEKLDFTVGARRTEPESLEAALGQKLTAEDLRKCFSCHATNAVSETQELRLESLIPGVSCEACHGPAAAHVEAAKEGKSKTVGVFSPAKMAGNELSQRFCGSCHRSHEEVMAMPDLGGAGNIRFQPYRLAKSACYYGNPADRRISCIACHDPHAPLAREPASYDAKCLGCHVSGASLQAGPTAKACRKATKRCSNCHMPKFDLPGAHAKFTDHFIRIVRSGASYPK
jgi:Zn finger protein HypA/HybF involved in hydrogenase expression